MPNVSKQYSPAGSSPDTPSSKSLPRQGHGGFIRKQGANAENTGNLNVVSRMNQGVHHTTSASGGNKRK